jgi:hypothetical protein
MEWMLPCRNGKKYVVVFGNTKNAVVEDWSDFRSIVLCANKPQVVCEIEVAKGIRDIVNLLDSAQHSKLWDTRADIVNKYLENEIDVVLNSR